MAMCEGLQKLLEAAQFLEQQEKLKLSPQQPAVQIAHINEQQQQFVVHCPPAAYEHNGTSGHHANTNNNNSSILSTRNSNTRHTNQVSSSAPAAGATFHHANGLTITSSGGNNVIAGLTNGSSGSNSQLVAAAAAAATNHHNNDYEFSNGNVGGGAAIAATSAAAATINGRSSEGRMSEDAFSSHISTSTTSNPNTNSASIILLPTPANSTNNSHEQQGQLAALQQHHQQQHPNKATAYTLVDNSHIAIVSNAAASKQMLLNGGIRIKSPTATIGSSSSKAISIPSQQQPSVGGSGNCKLMSSSASAFPPHSTSLPHSMPRHKSPNTLTPPPVASRKCAETHARIRSYSLSNKFPANQLHLHHNGSASNHMSMIVDDAHMSNSSSSNHSPPRHGLGMGGSASGSHYIQMITSQQGGAGSQLTHVSSPIGGSGRRRTISSNSNGAGTREVHNKLEKNRRAHLKECYESLKNQLPLKEEDRKKTSNLSILGEALKYVMKLQREGEDLDAQIEQEAKKKINAQKRIVSLKRELGPKYEQKFSGIFPDIELGSIPSERENLNDSVSLSSGRGSMLYSSSSSLSSGGSNTMSSPVGAGLQTAMPTAISPVISKTNSNSIINNNSSATASASAATSPISANMLQHLKSSASVSANNSSPAGSPTAILNGIVNVGSCPLSLTAKNISATSLTRGSPTPSTPSPSPSSSSGVSSSSSLISSSPPMNGVINGRTVTVNIPNGLKFQTSGGATIGTIGNGTASAAATIIATTAPGNVVGGGSNSNNAHAQSAAVTVAATITSSSSSTTTNQNGYRHGHHGRKKSLSIGDDARTNGHHDKHDYEDGEQPAKFIKVYNGLVTADNCTAASTATCHTKQLTNGQLQLSQVVGGGSLVVSPCLTAATASMRNMQQHAPPQLQKLLLNGGVGGHTNEIGRLPGGAELNILPTNGIKSNGATAFYHASGKLTLVNGGAAAGGNNGILLKDHIAVTSASPPAGLTPFFVASSSNGSNGVHYAGNFAQLIAATSAAGSAVTSTPGHVQNANTAVATAAHERLNAKLSLSVGAQALPRINTQYLGAMKPMVVTVAAAAVEPPTPPHHRAAATLAGKQLATTNNSPTFSPAYASASTSSSLLIMETSPTLATATKTATVSTAAATTTVPPITSSTLLLTSLSKTSLSSSSATMTTSATSTKNAVVTGTTNGNAL